MKNQLILLLAALFLTGGCAPKSYGTIADPAAEVEPWSVVSGDPACVTFTSSKYPDDAINAHAVYRTFLRSNDLESAFPHWQRAFELAPAADGKRSFHYTDGVRFYKEFFYKSQDEQEKAGFAKKVRELYEGGLRCYPRETYLHGMYAFDLYYSFRPYATDQEIYDLFKRTIDAEGERTGAFVLNPFTDILITRFQAGEISVEETRTYVNRIKSILAYGLVNSQEIENFKIVESYVPARLEELETVEDFFPPSYYAEKYYAEYQADPANCDVIQTVYSRLRWGKVAENDPRLMELSGKVENDCRVEETLTIARQALEALQAGKYRDAVKGFEQAAEETEDLDRKARYNQLIAKIQYAHLKNFSQARTYALKAAKLKPNWGEPHLLIGKLYASSGPLCGPGRGWDSQVVTWVAIDKWQYAKSIDPSVADEAIRLINQYSPFMPSIEDIFQRNLQEGASYTVGCWIQETTRIRAGK
jgi:hypothetical protein